MSTYAHTTSIVEKLLALGAKPDPKVIALYPFRETVRQAKADLIARLAAESEPPTKVKVDCTHAPEYVNESMQLACSVANLLLHEPKKAASYPEMVEELNLFRWAYYACTNPGLIKLFRSGRTLQ